ncbi:MAG TPA: YciI family protein, partial [Marinobacter sp.]|nr:YciI family protein [Marinobacter sp.]
MKYMMMRKADADTERGILPSQEILQAMADYNERLMQAGVFVNGNGLRPSSEGCRVEFHNGAPLVTTGPFDQTGELLAGYS